MFVTGRFVGARLLMSVAATGSLGGCAVVDTVFHHGNTSDGIEDAARPAVAQPAVVHKPASGDLLVAGGVDATLNALASAEFFQQSSGTFMTTGPLRTGLAGLDLVALTGGTKPLLTAGGSTVATSFSGSTLTVDVMETADAALYDVATGRFGATGRLPKPRALATATRLNDGTVLVAGGFGPLDQPVATAEIYQPATGTFVATAGAMHVSRALHTATLLPSGKVLIVGGFDTTTGGTSATAELYNPATGRFAKTRGAQPYALGFAGHTATLISGCGCELDGQVLIADGGFGITSGGVAYDETNPVALLYNPATESFAEIAPPTDPRVMHTATLLPGGKVLLAGGFAGAVNWGAGGIGGYASNRVLGSAEIFDPATRAFSCVGGANSATFSCNPSMTYSRGAHVAALLTAGPDAGKVLLAGGIGLVAGGSGRPVPTSSAELFDPAAPGFAAASPMNADRALAAAAIVP